MADVLDFFVPGTTDGRCGSIDTNLLTEGKSFGSWGAITCVIVLAKLPDGNLFCGHMACGVSGQAKNEAIIKTKTKELLTMYVGNKKSEWTMTGGGGDDSNLWIKNAIETWFENAPVIKENKATDGYFIHKNDTISFEVNSSKTNAKKDVSTGNFEIEP